MKTCAACKEPISGTESSYSVGRDTRRYHLECLSFLRPVETPRRSA